MTFSTYPLVNYHGNGGSAVFTGEPTVKSVNGHFFWRVCISLPPSRARLSRSRPQGWNSWTSSNWNGSAQKVTLHLVAPFRKRSFFGWVSSWFPNLRKVWVLGGTLLCCPGCCAVHFGKVLYTYYVYICVV